MQFLARKRRSPYCDPVAPIGPLDVACLNSRLHPAVWSRREVWRAHRVGRLVRREKGVGDACGGKGRVKK